MPPVRFDEALTEPSRQDWGVLRRDADADHGFGDQAEDRFPPSVRVTDMVMHRLPVMPWKPAFEQTGNLRSRHTVIRPELVQHLQDASTPQPRPSCQGAIKVPKDRSSHRRRVHRMKHGYSSRARRWRHEAGRRRDLPVATVGLVDCTACGPSGADESVSARRRPTGFVTVGLSNCLTGGWCWSFLTIFPWSSAAP